MADIPVYNISGEEPVHGTLDSSEVQQGIASGQFSFPKGTPVNVMSPEGVPGLIQPEEASEAFNQGYSYITPEMQKQNEFGAPNQQAIAAVEGLAKGVAGPLATGAEVAMGVPAEDIRAREDANPWTAGLSEGAGFIGSMAAGVGEARLVTSAAEAASKGIGLGLEGASTAEKIAAAGVRASTEMALLSSGDEMSKYITQDPNQSVESAISHVGLSSLLGLGGGAALGSIAPLWKASVGDRAAQFVEDFKGRINERMVDPNPTATVTDELGNYYKNITDMADEVYGVKGLKAQDIAKVMPEMSTKMGEQAGLISEKLDKALEDMRAKPNLYPERLSSKLENDVAAFKAATESAQAPADVFNAAQELKQTLDSYAKFDKFVKPVDEAYDFVNKAKELRFAAKEVLEDSSVWGKAADRQKAINKAFSTYLPALKDFNKKFTTEVLGERVVDPSKINTYMNGLGKPSAELKQNMLENFLNASEKYRNTIADTHANLGLESPFQATPMGATLSTIKEVAPGAKVADILIAKGIAKISGQGIGALTGGALGSLAGHGYIGALIGQHAIGPFIESVLPSMTKAILDNPTSGSGIKSAMEVGSAILKGEAKIGKGVKGIFKAEGELGTISQLPTEKEREKLEKHLKVAQENPESLMKVGGDVGHYMPQHATAMAETAARASTYLNNIRPKTQPANALDPKITPSSTEKANYNRAVDIALNPLIVLKSIKEGEVGLQDITHLNNLYPALYNRLKQEVMKNIGEAVSDKQSIPYKTKLGASAFLGQPLDSSMQPQAIAASQMVTMPPQNQQPKNGTAPKNMNKLDKLPEQSDTMVGSREAYRTSRH